jgi:hypothetical protein
MSDDTWECLLCRYIDHGSPEGIDAWTQTHLLNIINMAEAELTRRHAPIYDPQQGISAADCESHKLEVGGSSPPPATSPQAPIACIRIGEDDTMEVVHLYAPGLPPGSHDLYCDSWEGWQPIETAPKDGTPVLGYCTSEFYDGRKSRLIVTHHAGRFHEWVVPGVGGLTLSHWMPLPSPPQP